MLRRRGLQTGGPILYAVISDRNVFHLNPIPPPPAADATNADLPVVKLSGFIEISHKMRALFSSTTKHAKSEPIYYNLAEGEKTGILELVKIHYHEGIVDIINSGTPMSLNVKEDSLAAKAPSAPLAGERGKTNTVVFPEPTPALPLNNRALFPAVTARLPAPFHPAAARTIPGPCPCARAAPTAPDLEKRTRVTFCVAVSAS